MIDATDDAQPTFRYCPECGAMVLTDGTSFWCADECGWPLVQTKIQFPKEPTPKANA